MATTKYSILIKINQQPVVPVWFRMDFLGNLPLFEILPLPLPHGVRFHPQASLTYARIRSECGLQKGHSLGVTSMAETGGHSSPNSSDSQGAPERVTVALSASATPTAVRDAGRPTTPAALLAPQILVFPIRYLQAHTSDTTSTSRP